MTGMGQKSTKTFGTFPQMFGLLFQYEYEPSMNHKPPKVVCLLFSVMVVVLPQWLTIILSIIVGLILVTQHL